jgi:hypothetical protein
MLFAVVARANWFDDRPVTPILREALRLVMR